MTMDRPRAKLLFVRKGETHTISYLAKRNGRCTSESIKAMCEQTWRGMKGYFRLTNLKMEHDGWMVVPQEGPEVNEYGEVAP